MILKFARNKAGLTQLELAEKSGVKRGTIANIEAGLNKPSIETAKLLAEALDVGWFEFFEEEGDDGTSADCQGGGEGARERAR